MIIFSRCRIHILYVFEMFITDILTVLTALLHKERSVSSVYIPAGKSVIYVGSNETEVRLHKNPIFTLQEIV